MNPYFICQDKGSFLTRTSLRPSGNQLRLARTLTGLTVDRVGTELSINPNTVSRIERTNTAREWSHTALVEFYHRRGVVFLDAGDRARCWTVCFGATKDAPHEIARALPTLVWRLARHLLGLTIYEVGAAIGVNGDTVRKHEVSPPAKRRTRIRLAEFYYASGLCFVPAGGRVSSPTVCFANDPWPDPG